MWLFSRKDSRNKSSSNRTIRQSYPWNEKSPLCVRLEETSHHTDWFHLLPTQRPFLPPGHTLFYSLEQIFLLPLVSSPTALTCSRERYPSPKEAASHIEKRSLGCPFYCLLFDSFLCRVGIFSGPNFGELRTRIVRDLIRNIVEREKVAVPRRKSPLYFSPKVEKFKQFVFRVAVCVR